MSKFLFLPTGLALTAGLVLASTATAQTSATFVKDININPAPTPSNPSPARTLVSLNSHQWVMMGGKFYFQASTVTSGIELYVSDGTAAGTKMVADINKGNDSSIPSYFTLVGSKIFFRASTSTAGSELWVTDGTAAGTKLVADIRPGSSASSPTSLARVGTKVVFSANDGGTKGTELWVSDGTKAGTKLLKDILPGTSSSNIGYCTSNVVGNKVFFRANDGTHGSELWVTDGTAAGTKLVKDIRSGSLGSYPTYLQVLGTQKVVFEADDGTHGTELWVSDGTSAGTKLVKDVYAGASRGTSLYSATPFGGTKVLFLGRTAASGDEAWVTDGTAKGTFQVADIRSGPTSSNMYYSAQDSGKAYWGASSAAGKYEIWVTDGTKANTKRFGAKDMTTGQPSYIAATNGTVFFEGRDVTAGTGYEISMCTATTSKTVKDIRSGTSSGHAYFCYPIAKGVVAFAADDGMHGRELWISKGTAATTTMIDINKPSSPPTQNDNVSYIESLFGKIIFAATDGIDKTKKQHGQELWISDGSAAGTKLLKDIYVGTSTTYASSSDPSFTCRLGNYVYFGANDGKSGTELWRTDGTTAGTKLFKDIRPGSSGSSPSFMTRIGDKIYFQANDGTNGYELWGTDGTAAGTKMVKNLQTASGSSSPISFARLGHTSSFVFQAYTSATGHELFISDGTSAGTKLLKDIRSGSSSSYPTQQRSWGEKVYFQANDGAHGYELWVTDGTAAGTKMVKDLYPGISSGYAQYIELQNKKIFFSTYSKTAGYEMHVSDGTSAGTKLYWDLNAGTASTFPAYMTAVGSRRVYFLGDHSTTTTSYGLEPIWFDVTTKAGAIWNINPTGGSFPYNWQGSNGHFSVDNGSVYMAARPTNVYDDRLLNLQNGATAQAIGRISDSSVLRATDPRIGKNMSVTGATGVKNPLTVLCLGVADSAPNSLGSFVPDSYAYFQLTTYFWVVGNYPGKAWGSVFGVPNDTSLLGDMAVMQAFSLNALAFPAQTEATNGVHLTFGK